MSGVTPNGIRYPDGASKAKNLGPELQQMAEDIDRFIDEQIAGEAPEFQRQARAAVVLAIAEQELINQTQLNAADEALRTRILAEIDEADYIRHDEPIAPQLSDGVLWAAEDARRRRYLAVQESGLVSAPVGTITPYAGVSAPAGILAGTFDPVRRRFYQDAIGLDGKFLPSTVADLARRIGGGSAARTAPVLVTGSAGSAQRDTETAVHARALFRMPARARRARIHVRNYNDREAVAFGSVAATSFYLGAPARVAGEPAPSFAAAPLQILTARNITGAAETVGEWFDVPATGLLMLAYGYTATGDTHLGMAGGWRSTAPADVAQQTPATAMTAAKTLPLDIWFEVELPADVRIIATITDSHGLASNSETPLIDAFTERWAAAAGVALMPHSNHGSSLANWADPTQWKWQKYAGLSRPDAALILVGSNTIFGGTSLAQSQADFAAVVNTVRQVLCDTVAAGTMFARQAASTDAARDQVRRDYNTWLLGLPAGIVNTFDIARAIEDPATSNPVLPLAGMLTADNTHLTRRGHGRAAAALSTV